MKSTILITAALFTAGFFFQSCDNNSSTSVKTDTDTTMSNMEHKDNMDMKNMNNGMMKSMNASMDKMKAVKMNGDFDAEFAGMMIEHHQGAIDMANIELKSGSDQTLKTMAKNIITSQTAEIQKFKAILATHKENIIKGEHPELMEAMKDMSSKMSAMKMMGNVDKDFAMMMKVHHEGAIAMAKGELGDGKDNELKLMAQKIISDQTKEIKDFSAWLASQK